MNNNKEILDISIEDIIPNRFQPRLTFDMEALNELATSIKEHGIIQPLVVRRAQDKYEIIAGERRYKAATLIGMQKVPCIVMDLNDNESAEVAVIENIQRKEMTPLEEAKSFKKLLDKGYLTQDELARRMGKSQSTVANKLRLLNLDDLVQDSILNGKISERHARSLLRIQNKDEQRKILVEILEKRLTVKQTDDLIRERYGVENTIQNNGFEPNMNQTLSRPEVTIPIHNVTNDVNPQLNLINNLGRVDPQIISPPVVENTPSIEVHTDDEVVNNPALDMFRTTPISNNNGFNNPPYEEPKPDLYAPVMDNNTPISQPNFNEVPNNMNTEFNNPIINNEPINDFDFNKIPTTPNENIESIINPSVFSSDTQTSLNMNKPQPTFQGMIGERPIDNSINEAETERKLVDLDDLSSESNKNTNLFKQEPSEMIDISVPTPSTNKYEEVVSKINDQIKDLNTNGANIYKEEMDLGSAYQIVIRIDK